MEVARTPKRQLKTLKIITLQSATVRWHTGRGRDSPVTPVITISDQENLLWLWKDVLEGEVKFNCAASTAFPGQDPTYFLRDTRTQDSTSHSGQQLISQPQSNHRFAVLLLP